MDIQHVLKQIKLLFVLRRMLIGKLQLVASKIDLRVQICCADIQKGKSKL